MTRRVLAVRADNAGDVVLTGPAVRALARDADEVVFLAGPSGAPAARLLPGVSRVLTHELPWIAADPAPVHWPRLRGLVRRLRRLRIDDAVVFTSFHQSALPLALLLRAAGIRRIGAISVDYPGALLDVRHAIADDVHEVERNLSLVRAMGYRSPDPEGDRLRLRTAARALPVDGAFVLVHPGASVPARTWSPSGFAGAVRELTGAGLQVAVTGSAAERGLTQRVAGGVPGAVDLAGRTDFQTMVALVAAADCVVTGNTGPAHIAAATRTPVVSIYPPTVPAVRWRPWRVPTVLLGEQTVGCAGCRVRECPVGHRCLAGVTVDAVVDAVHAMRGARAHPVLGVAV